MITSGNHTRSISTQSGGILDFEVRFQDSIGTFQFGLSGNDFFGVSCSDGQLSINDTIFSSIENDSKRIRLEYSNDTFNLHVDGVKVVNGATKPTGNYEHLVINSSNNIEHTTILSGKEPVLDFQILNSAESGNNIISGFLNNSTMDRRFRIFDVYVDSNYSSRFSVTGWESGVCSSGCLVSLLSLDPEPSNASGIKINFESNFGPFSILTNIPSSFSGTPNIFSVSPANDTYFDSIGSKLFNVLSFFQGANRNLEVTLEYVSGGLSDQLRSLESGPITGWISGFVRGCSTVQQFHTEYLTDIIGMSGYTFSGEASGYLVSPYCHTGELVYNGLVYLSGVYASGDHSGDAYLIQSGVSLTGTVLAGSGSYLFNQLFNGISQSGSEHIAVSGEINLTEYLYATEGRIAGTGTSGLVYAVNQEISGFYSGRTLLTEVVDYYYNQSGWSGIGSVTLSGLIVPTGFYSGTVVGLGEGAAPDLSPISGMLTGSVTGNVTGDNGYGVFEGTILGYAPYSYSGCKVSGERLIGNILPSVVTYYDPYSVRTGTIYTFGFSPIRDYLLGSGYPCNAYLSGMLYESTETGSIIPISEVRVDIRRRDNNSLVASKFLTEYVRSEYVEISSGVNRLYPVHRVAVPELTGINFTGEVYITGYYILEGDYDDLYNANYIDLSLVPYMSGLIEDSGVVSYDYIHTGYLTGSGSVMGSGTFDGTVSGIWTLMSGTGIASGIMLGPEVPVSFTDMWNLKSGLGGQVYDFKESGWFIAGQTGRFENSDAAMVTVQNIFNEPFIEVHYSRALNRGVSVAKLSVFDGYNLEEIQISGF